MRVPRRLVVLAALLPPAVQATDVTTLTGPITASGDIAVDVAGNLYVADFGDLLANPNGTQVLKITPAGAVSVFATGLSGASGNEFDDQGILYQSNFASGEVSKIDPLGNVTTFSTGHTGPVGVAFDDDGNVYVANCADASIKKVEQDGTWTTLAQGQPLSCPNGLTFAADGNLYTCNFNNGNVVQVTLGGAMTVFTTVPGGSNAHITFARGALWVVSRLGSRIFRLDLDGTLIRVAGRPARGNADGDEDTCRFSIPNGIAFSPDETKIYTNSAVDTVGLNLNPVLVRVIDISTSVDAPVAASPSALRLRTYPNPARSSVLVEYHLPRPSSVSLRVFDVRGRVVRTLVDEAQPAGPRTLRWDGTDVSGVPLPAGAYWYRIRTTEAVEARKFVLIR